MFILRHKPILIQYTKGSEASINAQFMQEFFDDFPFRIRKKTFVVLDTAPIHKAKMIKEMIPFWQILKGNWLVPEDYLEKDTLFYALNRCMENVGKELEIKFKPFKPK